MSDINLYRPIQFDMHFTFTNNYWDKTFKSKT